MTNAERENALVTDHEDPAGQLLALEPITHRLPSGADREAISALLEDEFFEVGASGALYSRGDVIDTVARRYADGTDPDDEAWRIDNFSVLALANDLYLVTYQLHFAGRPSQRATVWRRHESRWRAVYHQGSVHHA
ncbi:DUF4440 domain-containing protein [Microbacteriaceae bacterium VKM Ac-2854]|nr:DUF4440 domain-containing protein [Microbacteriaceae bacterium VKM Ac-2854]